MKEQHTPGGSTPPRRPRHVLAYYCAAGVLLVRFVTAGLVYFFAADDDDAAAEIANARMYQRDVEVIGGKFAVYLDEFNRWFASLWHGRALAWTLAVLAIAIAIAIVCVRVGDLMSSRRDD